MYESCASAPQCALQTLQPLRPLRPLRPDEGSKVATVAGPQPDCGDTSAGLADGAPTPDHPLRAQELEGLDDAAKARFLDRRDRLLAWGYGVEEAESMALRLARRDAEQDDRRPCIECRHLERGGRCARARAGRLLPDCGRNFEPPRTLLQRCPLFEPRGRS